MDEPGVNMLQIKAMGECGVKDFGQWVKGASMESRLNDISGLGQMWQ